MPFSGVVMHGARVGDHVDIAKLGDELGYRDAWVTEVQGPDAITVMTAAALATTNIHVATGIVSNFTRSPYLMAMTANALQDVSGGRFIAGFGTSTPAIVTGWHGLPWGKPLGATREYVDLFRRFSAGERVKHDGIYKTRGASLRPAEVAPKVYLGALNDRMLELAGEIGDGVILNFPTPSYAAHAVEAIESGIAKSGRERSAVDIVAFLRTAVTTDFEPAAGVVRRELIAYFMAPVYQKVFTADGYGAEVEAMTGAWAAGDRAGALEHITDRVVSDHSLIGSVEDCLAGAQQMLDAGVDRAILFPISHEGEGKETRILETVRALAPNAAR